VTTNTESQPASCASCGSTLAGPYCSRCGEELLTSEKRTLRHFLGHIITAELLNFDGKIRRTMNLLFTRPGFLSAEYALGRRRLYLHPFRIMLLSIIAYALATLGSGTSFTLFNLNIVPSLLVRGSLGAMLFRVDRSGVIEARLVEKIGVPVAEIPDGVVERFGEYLVNLATPLSFTVVLLLGALLFVLFNRRRPLFLEHLVFGMHYYSFALFSAALATAMIRMPLEMPSFVFVLIGIGVSVWPFLYLAFAVRRFYLQDMSRLTGWLTAAVVAAVLVVFNGVFITAIQLASGLVAAWLL
jgi:hypothetical protein